jgi:hypothetical protein
MSRHSYGDGEHTAGEENPWPDLQRRAVNNKTAIRLRLQEFEFTFSFFESLHCSLKYFSKTSNVTL